MYYVITEDDVLRVADGKNFSLVHEKYISISPYTFERAFKAHSFKWDVTRKDYLAEAYATLFKHQYELNLRSSKPQDVL